MKTMKESPANMTRVLVIFYQTGIFEFAYFKDGLFEIGEYWYEPSDFKGWISIGDLKEVLGVL